jgi:hypothetical protein
MTTSKRKPNEPDPANEVLPLVGGLQLPTPVPVGGSQRQEHDEVVQEEWRYGCEMRWVKYPPSNEPRLVHVIKPVRATPPAPGGGGTPGEVDRLDREGRPAGGVQVVGGPSKAPASEGAAEQLGESGAAEDPGPLSANENAVLRFLQSLPPDASGHPGAMKGPTICEKLSRRGVPMGDDELRRVAKQLKARGLADSQRGRGYWATRPASEQPT